MKNYDLFGIESEAQSGLNFSQLSKYQKFKRYYHYRESFGMERCGNCDFHVGAGYHNVQYHKCRKMGISHSSATDIRVNNLCDLYEHKKDYLELGLL